MVLRQEPKSESANDKQVAHYRGPSSRPELNVGQEINSKIEANGKGQVRAYVVLALHEGDETSVVSSTTLENTVKPLMQQWADSHLRVAHEYSAGFVEGEEDDGDAFISQYTTINDHNQLGERHILDAHSQRKARKSPKSPIFFGSNPKPGEDWVVHGAFQIDDADSVAKTLMSCLYYLQQATLKRIAKAWIKGICPHKQAKFPYRNKKGEGEGKNVVIPPWWPSEKLCPFKEPDHVDKWGRMQLCLHFLRLRPTVQELQGWNREKSREPMKTHQPYQWVAFLQELAPLSVVDDICAASREKSARRRKVIQKMYDVAKLEESYKDDEIDGNSKVQPLEPDLQKTIVRAAGTKRSRQAPVATSTELDETSDWEDSLVASAAKKRKTIKAKDASKAAAIQPRSRLTRGTKSRSKPKTAVRRESQTASQSQHDVVECKPVADRLDDQHSLRAYEQAAQSGFRYPNVSAASTPGPLNTSFGSTMSEVSSCDYMADMLPLKARQYYQPAMQHQMQVHHAYDVPQPQFDTMPNTPTFAPGEFLPFEQQHPNLGHDMAGLSIGMPVAQRPPPQKPQVQQPMIHGLPSTPASHQYKQWPEMQPQPFHYEAQHGLPSTQTQHVGFAGTSFSDPPPNTSWTTPYNNHPHIHPDHEMPYTNPSYGPNHDLPPAALPASVERGFTGHASGVGDSACPPGYAHPVHYFG